MDGNGKASFEELAGKLAEAIIKVKKDDPILDGQTYWLCEWIQLQLDKQMGFISKRQFDENAEKLRVIEP